MTLSLHRLTEFLEEYIPLGPKYLMWQLLWLIYLPITYSSTTDCRIASFRALIASPGPNLERG